MLFSITSTEQAKEKDQEKWHSVVINFDSNLKNYNFDAALEVVEKFESDCKSAEFCLQALVKKARGSFEAWKHASKGGINVLNREINKALSLFSFVIGNTLIRVSKKELRR